jgi:pimeloyl-ACP methyl ester carboxylesterase
MMGDVTLPIDRVALTGTLVIPDGAVGLVLFAHGSGSSRLSPRNRFVARALGDRRLATLLFDLLTPEEAERDAWTGDLRFDIDFLAERLAAASLYCLRHRLAGDRPLGLFGSSTGAAAALVAAARLPDVVTAVVSRGGRPDLAGAALPLVRAPTRLIVGGDDVQVLELNRAALGQLHAEADLQIVPGATHLFEEPGALRRVSDLASEWFLLHLAERPLHPEP